ncbi:MAG: hypothetical protein N2D54_07090, partial [Chloroflexota bacterium]
LGVIFLLIGSLGLIIYVLQKQLPKSTAVFSKILTAHFPFLSEINSELPAQVVHSLKNSTVWLAALALGLCTAIRSLGLAAGGLIALLFILNARKQRVIAPLIAYFMIAAGVLYLSWPFLWPAPLTRFLESFQLAATSYQGKTLFNGNFYHFKELPWTYLPTLVGAQFTEPTILLCGLGIFYAIKSTRGDNHRKSLILLASLWLFFPVTLVLLFKPSIHDNFRHLLFIIPPIFIFSGFLLEVLFQRIKKSWFSILLTLAIILPGIIHIFQAHPYEYIYYNRFVGGLEGAKEKFDMDYAGLSFKDSTSYLNQIAEKNATVLVWGPFEVAIKYLRNDLIIEDYTDNPDQPILNNKTYWLILTNSNNGLVNTRDAKDIYYVTSDDITLSIGRKFNFPTP